MNYLHAVEWSFDLGWSGFESCPWLPGILNEYSEQGRLYGHGVHFSLLDGNWTEAHEKWLDNFGRECSSRQYKHISEHFGYMAREIYMAGAPLPPPMNDQVLELAKSHFDSLAEVANCPMGLENLAFSFSKQGALKQYTFLNELLTGRGFLLLDLHNLYCQVENFGIDLDDVFERISPSLVREIHISGGSWSFSDNEPVRRDTHDDAVPEAVFDLLAVALPHLPNVELITLERLGNTFINALDAQQFQRDFLQMKEICTGVR